MLILLPMCVKEILYLAYHILRIFPNPVPVPSLVERKIIWDAKFIQLIFQWQLSIWNQRIVITIKPDCFTGFRCDIGQGAGVIVHMRAVCVDARTNLGL